MWPSVVLICVLAVMGEGLEPTGVATPPQRTQPPTDVSHPQYAQTLYKATDYVIVKNTLVPLWPSYSVDYQSTHTTTVINQTISSSTVEFATMLNTTVDYYTPVMVTNTYDVAPTTYQTMDFQHQTVLFTDRKNVSHSTVEHNDLPFV